jgi:transposase
MLNSDRSVPEVAIAMGIGENLLYKWKADEKSKLSPDVRQQHAELEQLRKQSKQTEMERDILKKALAIFSRVT